MYEKSNLCFFHRPDGSLDSFTQEDGFPQGDPLSPALACLVINRILTAVNTTLRDRAQTRRALRQLGNDGCGSKSAAHAYFDDAFSFVPYEDLPAFIDTFQRIGAPMGIILNKHKTKILTVPVTQDTASTLSPPQQLGLHKALSMLNGPASEIKGGTRLLGQPLGTNAFCSSYLALAAQNFATATKRLTKRIADPQSIATLFKFCTLPSISHLLSADVLHHTDLSSIPALHSWTSSLTKSLQITNQFLFQQITNTHSQLPPLALFLAYLPLRKGGLGYRDHTKASLPAFLVPIIRSIRYATIGIPYRHSDKNHTLAPIYVKTLSTWQSARHPSRLIQVFRHYLPALTMLYRDGLFTKPRPITSRQLILELPTKGLQSQLYHHFTTKAFSQFRPSLDESIHDILPSLLSPTTSIPLHSLPRRFADHRFPPDIYRLLLRRKLRLPLFDTSAPPPCPFCPQLCDPHGDHFFTCGFSKRYKATYHNHVRDTLFSILQLLAPLAGIARSKHDVQREPSQRIPDCPKRRPLDVSIDLLTPTAADAITVGIDVTIPPISSALSKKSNPSIPLITRTHLASIRSKFHGRTTKASTAEAVIQSLNAHHIAFCLSPPLLTTGLSYHGTTTHPHHCV
jgi:hypothetical protein